ncbi:MAG TPA: dienelactone hydrolase family protein [Burkholderiales bacterium]|nr:dienelactone hydrolase family protein [Burkholderiales bacterium]
MTVRWHSAPLGGKSLRLYLGVPDSPGPHPGVVIAHHAFGIDESMQDMAHRLVREGYAVAIPDLFHRQPEGLERVQRTQRLRDDEILADVGAAVAALKASMSSIGALGMMGFCMGGRVAYLAACGIRGFDAAAVFYGGNIMKALGEGPSPLERTAGLECPLIGFFGMEDTNPSPEDVARIDAELSRLGKWHEFHRYHGAGHAFHNFTDERYRERAARASWHELLAFFSQYLKRGGRA